MTPTPKVQIEQSVGPWRERLQRQIQQENRRAKEENPVRPERLAIRTPEGTSVAPTLFHRRTNPVVNINYTHITNRFGDPGFGFSYLPRPVNAFSITYRSGYFTGLHYGVPRHFHRRPVFVYFYFPFYFDDPSYDGFWYRGYYPSVYYYYGWLPRWCYPTGLMAYPADPYPYYYGGYSLYGGYGGPAYYYRAERPRLDEAGVDRALVDIRRAWLDSDIDRLAYYLRQGDKISVYFDNDYSYSLSADDYYSMTLDAMSTVRTLEMDFDEPTWINSREAFVTGRHVFVDPDNDRQTVYISYRLHRFDDRWYVIGVGSSPNPIRSTYRDFRYERSR